MCGKIGLYFNREVGFFPSVQFSQSVFAASLVIFVKRNCILKHVCISFKPLQLWPPLNNLVYWDISLCGVLLEGLGPEIHNTVSAFKLEVSLFLSCGNAPRLHLYFTEKFHLFAAFASFNNQRVNPIFIFSVN